MLALSEIVSRADSAATLDALYLLDQYDIADIMGNRNILDVIGPKIVGEGIGLYLFQ